MKYAAVIFDMDGTIIQSEHVWERATRELLLARGITMTDEQRAYVTHYLHGTDTARACAFIKEFMQLPDDLEQLIIEKRQRANDLYPFEISFIQGFTTFHQELRQAGIAISLATNAGKSTVAVADKKLNLAQFFGHHMYTVDHVHGIGKPDPRIFQYAAEQLGHAPHECLVIEDSPHGVTAAKRAGMTCIGIATAKKPELLQHADLVVNGYHELDVPTLLGKHTIP